VINRPDRDLAAVISEELAACRMRGIERLDVHSHNQVPVPTPELQRLANEYMAATQHQVRGRTAQLKYLLRDAIKAFGTENEADAQLIDALFFDDSQHRVTKSAGELLDITRKQFGFSNETRLRQARHDAFDAFAGFIPHFVANASRDDQELAPENAPESVPILLQPDYEDSVPDPEMQRHVATTGYIDNGEHFISLLSQATNATIISFPSEMLASMLRAALDRKRAAILRPDTCWESIRIVFLNNELLDFVNEDESEYPDASEALLQRRRAAIHGRRMVRVFLRTLPPARWKIYDSPYFPPLTGALFEMPSGQQIVQLLIRRPERSAHDHLYLELEDTRGHYFSATFDEIVHNSIDDNKVVPVGTPIEQRFRVTGTKYRQSVLIGGSRAAGWLALVLIMTWRVRNGRAEPLLQLRTHLNAARELDRFSHLAGHITQDHPERPLTEFGLNDDVPMAAARRRVQIETGEVDAGELKPLGTSGYFHPDKEHLFFFIYSCQFPEGFQLWRQAEMFPLPLEELLAIRKNQALRKALSLCQAPPSSQRIRQAAFEIATLNLLLHDYADLANKLAGITAQKTVDVDDIAAQLAVLEEPIRQSWPAFEGEVEVKGLSGLQYREFYTILLPFYADIDVPGAADYLAAVNNDEAKRAAVARLSELYHDEGLMESIPLEL
jgi:hypothetical protein